MAALLRRAGKDENVAPRTSMAASPSREDDDDEGIATFAGAATRPLEDGYPSKDRFEPEDKALVSDLLHQAQLLQDAVAAAAERLSPGPTRSALTEMASATNALGARAPIASSAGIEPARAAARRDANSARARGTNARAHQPHQRGPSRPSVEGTTRVRRRGGVARARGASRPCLGGGTNPGTATTRTANRVDRPRSTSPRAREGGD